MSLVYLGLGGNIGDSCAILQSGIAKISSIEGVSDVITSSFYQTTPVSDLEQPDYINAVCRCKTTLSPQDLFAHLQEIERSLGKSPKPKNAPRIIDIDLLFFGTEPFNGHGLKIPHPRWQERLFVLIPLLELTENIMISQETITLKKLINELPPQTMQKVSTL